MRTMGDATRANAATLTSLHLDMVAGYDTGTPDIKWDLETWNMFPHVPHVHIDQGYGDTLAIEAHVLIFDIEPGAFHPSQARAVIDQNQSARPTVYVNRDNMDETIASALQSSKWKGDVWLAFPGWEPGQPLPPLPPGCRYVAIQNAYFKVNDRSVVLDDTWPHIRSWGSELPIVRKGAKGVYVRRVQGLIVADGQKIPIDGIFGPRTDFAVRTLQNIHSLTVDGIVGPATWPVLLGVIA